MVAKFPLFGIFATALCGSAALAQDAPADSDKQNEGVIEPTCLERMQAEYPDMPTVWFGPRCDDIGISDEDSVTTSMPGETDYWFEEFYSEEQIFAPSDR